MCWVPGALETPSSCPKGLGLGALRRLQSQGFSPQSGGLWADGWPVRTHRSALSCGPVVLAAGLGLLNPQPLGDSHIHAHMRAHTRIYTHPTERGKPRERALGRMDEKLVLYCRGIRMAPLGRALTHHSWHQNATYLQGMENSEKPEFEILELQLTTGRL